MRVIPVILFSAMAWINTLSGQDTSAQDLPKSSPFVLGVVDQIQSLVLAENRIVNIYLPEGYSRDTVHRYPVIYLLDGSADEDFIHVAGIVQFLVMIQAIPGSIVVGIANVDRKRDLTFMTTIEEDRKKFPTTGGSAKFMAFIEKELQPFVEKKYRTDSSKTMIGQSLGGLFATEVLLKAPRLFNHYLIVSPSLWWDHESLLQKAPRLLEKQPDKSMRVYVSVGSEGQQMEADAKALTEILQASGKSHLKINFVPLPKESHLTILHNSVYIGLQKLFEPWIEESQE